ncbi:MAG: PLP-dependent aminotransferase family protein [Cyclobacterium sp.]|uniref:aminotransferase-like domain-containing protein n=1 Tax=unclassified Cyclobacterium TaxID=2615055 RepID=UPI0013D72CB2|nr:PLP-dependent aminotransferase family protein [Cyclobacterium sp. SYSU L10401]
MTLYQELAINFERLIQKGSLKVGDKMPSLRTVSKEYGVSINTVIQAYLVLESRSCIVSRPQAGFFVCEKADQRLPVPQASNPSNNPKEQADDGLIGKVFRNFVNKEITQLSLSVPDESFFPVGRLNKCIHKASQTLSSGGTGYDDIQGNLLLRKNVAKWTFTWAGNLGVGDLVSTSGAMHAISLAFMALTKPGDRIAVESPVYFGILQLAKNMGLKVIELPTHPVTGVDPDDVKARIGEIDICLLVSNFNNPLGSCMPEENKKAIVQLLSRHGIPLIEDDLYGDVYFGPNRPRPCKAFDEEGMVLWCGSVSKTLAPGYRVGWMAPGRFLKDILKLKLFHSVSGTALTQEAIGHFLESGRYEKHLAQMRKKLYANSLQFIRAVGDYFPEGTKVSRPQGGFVLWVELEKGKDTGKLFDRLLSQGISIAPGRMFTLQNQFYHCMRLNYGLPWSDKLDQQLYRLGQILKE